MKIYNDNCIDVMDKMILDNEKVDVVITSPPYDNLRDYEGTLVWTEDIWKSVISRLYGVTSKDGIVVWVVGDSVSDGSESGSSFRQALHFMEVGFKLHDTMIFEKNSSTFPARKSSNRYTQIFEYMFVFSKGSVKKSLICDKKNKWAGHKDYSGKLKNPVPEYSPRTNIWRYVTSKGKTGIHTAPFPEELVEDHIKSWCNDGDVIFDPFLGSGTTAVVSRRLGYDFVGCEIVPEYYEHIKTRLDNTLFDFMGEHDAV